ncbi:MAG: hypothetical protein WAW51_01200, partial [Ilumatobacteraceae bacterium]
MNRQLGEPSAATSSPAPTVNGTAADHHSGALRQAAEMAWRDTPTDLQGHRRPRRRREQGAFDPRCRVEPGRSRAAAAQPSMPSQPGR